MTIFIVLLLLIVGSGAAGYLYGAKVEAAAWKRVLKAKGFAILEYEKLRKVL